MTRNPLSKKHLNNIPARAAEFVLRTRATLGNVRGRGPLAGGVASATVRRANSAAQAVLICMAVLVQGCKQTAAEVEYDPQAIMSTQLTRDSVQVSDWMMGVNRLYPGDPAPVPAPPAGYKPIYLSHYGRHGSRYLAAPGQYAHVHEVLSRAGREGELSGFGEEIFARYEAVSPLYIRREGELTGTGAAQHRAIASRMYRNYPELFRKGSKVVANSTNYERTMLSMQNFTQTLVSLSPGLDLHTDASKVYQGRINQHSPENPEVTSEDVRWKSPDAPWRPAFWQYFRGAFDWRPVCGRLFKDPEWAGDATDAFKFVFDLYSIALVVPGCPEKCKGFFDVFTSGELSLLGQMDNYAFYMEKSRTPLGNKRGCYLSEVVLGSILDEAASDLEEGVRVRLRFGHDGCIMALFALLKLDGWNAELTDPSEAWKVWDVSQIPMAANFQIVLFGRGGLVKDPVFCLLLNEEPMALPLEDLGGHYYRWDDFLAYCRPILQEARDGLAK